MCVCDVDGYPDFSVTEYPRARKAYRCEECRGAIKPGERHVKNTTKWEGDVSSTRSCLECEAWAKVFVEAQRRECGEGCWIVGSLWSGIREFCEEHLGYSPKRREAA